MIPGSWTYKVFKLRGLTGALLCLPVWIGTAWYAWSAYATFDRHRRSAAPSTTLTAELFQIYLHDELQRHERRLSLPSRNPRSDLPVYSLSFTRPQLDILTEPDEDGGSSYAKGLLQKDGVIHDVRVRFRRGKHWNWVGTQKSMKVKLDRGDLVDGTRVFNLWNGVTPFGMEEEVIFGIARDRGLLTPEYNPVWLRLNNADMGVYRYAAQPAEGLLRRSRRMPASIYSGDTDVVDETRGAGALFFSPEGWTKVAWRNESEKEDMAQIRRFIRTVSAASHRDFAAFARDEINLERYATFDALDVVFGGNDHDYFTHHKLTVDPYSGRWEPIAWAFRGFHHEPTFNLVENPLLIRLKMTPGYLAQRDAEVYDLLTGSASVPNLRHFANEAFSNLAPDLAADPYWDAYKLLPRASKFHRFMVRPMSSERWAIAAEEELNDMARRSRFLLDALESARVEAHISEDSASALSITFTARPYAAARVVAIESEAAGCTGELQLFADIDRDGALGPMDPEVARGALGERAELRSYGELTDGVRLDPLPEPKPKKGLVATVREPRSYRYLLRTAGCAPSYVGFELVNSVTGSPYRLEPTPGAAEEPPTGDPAASTPTFTAGVRSAHPWSLGTQRESSVVRLGPGVVNVPDTRVFHAHQSVSIAPGTTLRLGPEASLIFYGRLRAEGSRSAPILIEPARAKTKFGGVALQGPRTEGSALTYLNIRGGTRVDAQREGVPGEFPGVFNVHHTRNITLRDLVVDASQSEAEDAIHINTVEELAALNVEILGAPVDGMDIEFSSGTLREIRVRGAGDDCFDLMGSELRVQHSLFQDCTNNAISAGEETQLDLSTVVISRARVGLLAKNASRARILRSLVFDAETALRTKRKEIHYDGPSSIGADGLFVVACERIVDSHRAAPIDVARLRTTLPAAGIVEQALSRVLGGAGLSELARAGGAP